jgi:hypothetical protein
MGILKLKIPLPDIPESEKTPLVLTLLAIIEHQASIIDQLNEEIQLLKDEIARLKGQNPKPKIRPRRLGSSFGTSHVLLFPNLSFTGRLGIPRDFYDQQLMPASDPQCAGYPRQCPG